MREARVMAVSAEDNQNNENKDFIKDGGKILTFVSDGKFFGFEITDVTDIIGLQPITRLPRTPNFVKGVINLRGKAVPVIDFRLRLGYPEEEYDHRSCIIVVEVASNQAGIICDRVSDVEEIASEQIAPSPLTGGTVKCFVTTAKNRISVIDPLALIKGKGKGKV